MQLSGRIGGIMQRFSFISELYWMPVIFHRPLLHFQLTNTLIYTLTHGHTNIYTIINFNHIPRVISWISLSWTLTGYAHHIWHVLLMRSCVSMYNMSHANINLLKSSRYDWFVHGIFIIWTVITMHGRILKVPVKRSITGNKNAKF